MMQGKRRDPTDSEVAMIAFMEELTEMEVEARPENDERYLNPSRFPSVRAVYEDFLEDYNQRHTSHGDLTPRIPMSEDTFRKKFAEFYPKLKIPKTNRFAQCDLCFLFRGKMELAAGEKKILYRRQLHTHHDHVRQDKARYYGNRYQSEQAC